MGVTDYAFEDMKKIGYKTILFIELPDVGKIVKQSARYNESVEFSDLLYFIAS